MHVCLSVCLPVSAAPVAIFRVFQARLDETRRIVDQQRAEYEEAVRKDRAEVRVCACMCVCACVHECV